MEFKKITIALFVAVSLATIMVVTSVSAKDGGNSPKHLSEAGWSCAVIGEVHCFSPGHLRSTPSIQVKVFDTGDLASDDNSLFLGTELLLRKDLWDKGNQSCPQDAPIFGIIFPGNGVEYVGCHHYDTGH